VSISVATINATMGGTVQKVLYCYWYHKNMVLLPLIDDTCTFRYCNTRSTLVLLYYISSWQP